VASSAHVFGVSPLKNPGSTEFSRRELPRRAEPVSLEAVAEVLARAVEDEEFRARLVDDPATALADYDLSPTERASFRNGELRELLVREGSNET